MTGTQKDNSFGKEACRTATTTGDKKEYGLDGADLLHVSTVNERLTQGGTKE